MDYKWKNSCFTYVAQILFSDLFTSIIILFFLITISKHLCHEASVAFLYYLRVTKIE